MKDKELWLEKFKFIKKLHLAYDIAYTILLIFLWVSNYKLAFSAVLVIYILEELGNYSRLKKLDEEV